MIILRRQCHCSHLRRRMPDHYCRNQGLWSALANEMDVLIRGRHGCWFVGSAETRAAMVGADLPTFLSIKVAIAKPWLDATPRKACTSSRLHSDTTNPSQQSRSAHITVRTFVALCTDDARKDGRRKEARPDREEAHEALQPPSVRPLQMCRPQLEEA